MKPLRELFEQRRSDPQGANGRAGEPEPQEPTAPGLAKGSRPELAEEPCPVCGGLGFFRRSVPVGHPDFGVPLPCRCTETEHKARQQARLLSRSPLAHLDKLTFATLHPRGRSGDAKQQELFRRALNQAHAFAEEPEGWLVFAGPSGSGKTHLAAAIAHACLEQGLLAFYIGVPDLLDHLRATYGPQSEVSYDELMDYLSTVPVLLLDDLEMQNATPWAQEKLFQLLDHRYVRHLPTVITTRTPPKELDDDRLRTRLTDEVLSKVCLLEDVRPLFEEVGGYSRERLENFRFHLFEVGGAKIDSSDRSSLRQALEAAETFAERPEDKPFLVLQGPSGVGKTHLAAAIANHHLDRGQSVFFASVPDLLDHLRAAFAPESREPYDVVFERVRTAPLLILDDLGSQSATAWAQEKLFQIINYRWLALLPTVVTTRSSSDVLGAQDERLASRLWDQQHSHVERLQAQVKDYRTGQHWAQREGSDEQVSGSGRPTPRPTRRPPGR